MADERDEPGEEQEPAEGVKIVDDEEPALRFGPDDTGPLPHWTEPPTGEVPKILAEEPQDDVDPWSSFSGQAPVWRDDQSETPDAEVDLTPLTGDLPAVDPDADGELFGSGRPLPARRAHRRRHAPPASRHGSPRSAPGASRPRRRGLAPRTRGPSPRQRSVDA